MIGSILQFAVGRSVVVVVRSKRSRNFAGADVAEIDAQFIYGLPSIVLATKKERNASAKSYELDGTAKAVELTTDVTEFSS